MRVKADLHNSNRLPSIKEGEVWWCSIGENIGIEIDGKSKVYTRPVLIYRKFSRFGFMGIPLTSKNHIGSWYVKFEFKDRVSFAVLSQAKTLSVARLHKKMGTLSKGDFGRIKNGFVNLYS